LRLRYYDILYRRVSVPREHFAPKRLSGALVLNVYVRLGSLKPSAERVSMNNSRRKTNSCFAIVV